MSCSAGPRRPAGAAASTSASGRSVPWDRGRGRTSRGASWPVGAVRDDEARRRPQPSLASDVRNTLWTAPPCAVEELEAPALRVRFARRDGEGRGPARAEQAQVDVVAEEQRHPVRQRPTSAFRVDAVAFVDAGVVARQRHRVCRASRARAGSCASGRRRCASRRTAGPSTPVATSCASVVPISRAAVRMRVVRVGIAEGGESGGEVGHWKGRREWFQGGKVVERLQGVIRWRSRRSRWSAEQAVSRSTVSPFHVSTQHGQRRRRQDRARRPGRPRRAGTPRTGAPSPSRRCRTRSGRRSA